MPAEAERKMDPDPKTEELAEIIRSIEERVRARHPSGEISSLGISLPDLMPVVHARDAAEAKVAAIGTVNPRRGGLANSAIQSVKRQIARGLGWFVRDQVQFNRALMGCVESLLTALGEANRTIAVLSARTDERFRAAAADAAALREEAAELKDIRVHWIAWREEWERKQFSGEVHLLRGMSDLQAGFHHRALLMETNFRQLEENFREAIKAQHLDFTASAKEAHAGFKAELEKSISGVQKRLWDDLERIRLDYEKLIHTELRVIRQRAILHPQPAAAAVAPAPVPALAFDYGRFAERFRGTEEYVRGKQQAYIQHFSACTDVLDIGCGRGEFLQMMREAGIAARGIDSDPESIAHCHAKGLVAEVADLFSYLDGLPEASLDGIYSSQVVEHLPPERIPELIRLAAAKLRRGGLIAIETPNPECLAIFATHFYLDPTHTRPVPAALMVFYLEEFGFGSVKVDYLSPAAESMPALMSIPPEFREAFFGGLDYAVSGRKLS
ncbi:MAG: methyltransferase domain-containing protein [Bryobacteraceae bacterium]